MTVGIVVDYSHEDPPGKSTFQALMLSSWRDTEPQEAVRLSQGAPRPIASLLSVLALTPSSPVIPRVRSRWLQGVSARAHLSTPWRPCNHPMLAWARHHLICSLFSEMWNWGSESLSGGHRIPGPDSGTTQIRTSFFPDLQGSALFTLSHSSSVPKQGHRASTGRQREPPQEAA